MPRSAAAYQEKALAPQMPPYWYVEKWHYLEFVLREASCLFVGYFAAIMLLEIRCIEHGMGSYAHFQALMSSPIFLIVNALALIFICFHAVTWFMLVPRVFARQVLGYAIPDPIAAAPNFGLWVAVSVIIALFAMRVI